jgi:hypothetical protein
MAKITINFADEVKFQRDLDANCEVYDYPSNKLANETKQEFVERRIREEFKRNSLLRRQAKINSQLTVEE